MKEKEMLEKLAKNMKKKENSNKLGRWINKNKETVGANIAKYVADVQKIICSTSITGIKFFSKSVKECYLLQHRNESSPDESLFKELDSLLEEFKKVHRAIHDLVIRYKFYDQEECKSTSST